MFALRLVCEKCICECFADTHVHFHARPSKAIDGSRVIVGRAESVSRAQMAAGLGRARVAINPLILPNQCAEIRRIGV